MDQPCMQTLIEMRTLRLRPAASLALSPVLWNSAKRLQENFHMSLDRYVTDR